MGHRPGMSLTCPRKSSDSAAPLLLGRTIVPGLVYLGVAARTWASARRFPVPGWASVR